MISIDVPGYGRLRLDYVVFDFNGTIALDGNILPGVAEGIKALASLVQVHVVTADSHGTCAEKLKGLPVTLHVLGIGAEDESKLAYVKELGREACVAVGNGCNDRLMLNAVKLGICIMGRECCCAAAAMSANVLAPDIQAAINFLLDHKRLIATLRS